MENKLSYTSIGHTLTMRMSVDNLSRKEQIILFRTLMDKLGITERMILEGESSRIIDEQCQF